MGMIMQDVTELKSIVKNAAGLEGLLVRFVSIKDDPDLYGDATESNYLPIIIGNPPINMFLEITLTDNGTVESTITRSSSTVASLTTMTLASMMRMQSRRSGALSAD